MSVNLSFEQKPGYLHVKVTGENTEENVFNYLLDVRGACARLKCPVVLIEENLKGPGLSLRSIFDVASMASENVRPTIERIAYVDTNKEHDQTKMKFAENVAVGLGVNVRVFTETGAAEKWLAECAADARSKA